MPVEDIYPSRNLAPPTGPHGFIGLRNERNGRFSNQPPGPFLMNSFYWLRHLRKGPWVILATGLFLLTAGLTLFTSIAATGHDIAETELALYWRTSYDVLVRPPQSTSFLDDSGRRLLEPNFLSGQPGGITMEQYETISALQGVEVAAPIAMVGHFPIGFRTWAKPVLVQPESPWAIYKDVRTVTVNDGARTFRTSDVTYTIHDRRDIFGVDPENGAYLMNPDGAKYTIASLLPNPVSRNPEKTRIMGRNFCVDNEGNPSPHTYNAEFDLYLLVAGIDPRQEQALVGIADAVLEGRYLTDRDSPRLAGRRNDEWLIPVLFNLNSFRDIEVETVTYSLIIPPEDELPERLESQGLEYLRNLQSSELQANFESLIDEYENDLQAILRRDGVIGYLGGMFWEYIQPSPINYLLGQARPEFRLSLEAQPIGISERSPIPAVPLTPREVSFREEHTQKIVLLSDDSITVRHFTFSPIGSFSLDSLSSDPLSQVPLESYAPPLATLRYDAEGKPTSPLLIYPTNNPLGYLFDTPIFLTTLDGARFLSQRDDFISAIRIRVSGVDEMGNQAQERIELVADEIEAQTGLQVDITLGSSPQPVLIHIPGYQEVPPLGYIEELWVRQMVGISLDQSISHADLLLFVALVAVSVSFAFSSSSATNMARQREFGLLRALGWHQRDVFLSLLAQAFSLAVLIGSLALSLSLIMLWLTGYKLSLIRAGIALVSSVFLFTAGAAYPAWKAAVQSPIFTIQQGIIRARELSFVPDSLWGYSLRAILRRPGRLLLSWLSLGFTTGLVFLFLSVSLEMGGIMEGSLLGQHIAVELQPYHYGLSGIAFSLSGLEMAAIAYLNWLERRPEIGLLKAIGWRSSSVTRLFLCEGALQGLASGLAGALIGLGTFFAFYRSLPIDIFWWLFPVLLLPVLIGTLAMLYPSHLASRVPPAHVMQAYSL